jgi:hypothetical protein
MEDLIKNIGICINCKFFDLDAYKEDILENGRYCSFRACHANGVVYPWKKYACSKKEERR